MMIYPRVPRPDRAGGRLAVLTSYYNPCRFASRYSNYVEFRKKLGGADVFTIELAFNADSFQLTEYDSVVRIVGSESNLMWQKERMLNVLLRHVPAEYTDIAWIDCDVVFENANWAADLQRLLQDYALVQLFHDVKFLGKSGDLLRQFPGLIWSCNQHQVVDEASYLKAAKGITWVNKPHPGLAWGCRREILDAVGLLDSNIIGNGDLRMAMASMSTWELMRSHVTEGEPLYQETLRWGKSFYELVRSSIAYVPGTIRHLYHGHGRNRQYDSRKLILFRHGFDPKVDIRLGANQLWEWASDKPGMHIEIATYFRERREDE
ncbi:MAG TPA: hypothetical protein VHO24_18155 [Opitutaceae bacterium]|nr:hypothetical protein [Opitutaceae bacterium]